jgi:hypothetical protein
VISREAVNPHSIIFVLDLTGVRTHLSIALEVRSVYICGMLVSSVVDNVGTSPGQVKPKTLIFVLDGIIFR